jgi:hypothetical protein
MNGNCRGVSKGDGWMRGAVGIRLKPVTKGSRAQSERPGRGVAQLIFTGSRRSRRCWEVSINRRSRYAEGRRNVSCRRAGAEEIPGSVEFFGGQRSRSAASPSALTGSHQSGLWAFLQDAAQSRAPKRDAASVR